VLDREATVEKACQLILETAANGAQLIIFPELFIPTYINAAVWGRGLASFGTANAKRAWLRLWQNSVEIPSHTTDRLSKTARDANAVVAIGLHERESKSRSLYNTLLFLNSDGTLLGKHRKLMPTNHERMVHGRGDGSTLRVYDTPVGRVGGLICWENWMPLSRFALYSQGEQIHIAPTADDDERTLINTRNTAIEGGVFVISVCMVLRKESFPKDFEFQQELEDAGDYLQTGGSAIIGPDGSILAGPLWKEEGILYAELDLNQVVEQSQLLDVAGHYARPDVLSLHLKATPQNVLEKPAKHT
jgi:nitrilase